MNATGERKGQASDGERDGLPIRAPGTIENDVLVGLDGMLFLARGAHKVMDFVTGRTTIEPRTMNTIRTNLAVRRRVCERSGASFLHVIAPDKQSIVSELWPFGDRPFVRLGQTVSDSIGEDVCDILYPLEAMRSIGAETVSRTDSHYTDFGAIIVAAQIADRLTGQCPDTITDGLLANLTATRVVAGDLGSKLDPVETSCVQSFAGRWPGRVWTNNVKFGNTGIIDIILNKDAVYPKRLALMGDSFGRHVAKFLQFYFREIVFIRSRYFHQELLPLYRPHYVVTQQVERYAPDTASDNARAHFLLLPLLNGKAYEPPSGFVDVLQTLLAVGRPPYAALVHDAFGTEVDLPERPHVRRSG